MGSEDARLVRDYAAMPQSRPQVCGGAEHQCGSSSIGLAAARKSPEAAQPSAPDHFRWRTDIRFDFRVRPPLLRSELLQDVELGSFRPFRGFQGSNVPVPSEVAAALMARAAPRLDPLPGENPAVRVQ